MKTLKSAGRWWMVWASAMMLPVCMLVLSAAAQAGTAAATQPSSAPAVNLDSAVSIWQALVVAFNGHDWPLVAVLAAGALLFVERHFKGCLGPRSSAWLGSWKGMLITSLLTAAVTSGLSAATGGWAALGRGCLIAVALAVVNFAAQFARQSTSSKG